MNQEQKKRLVVIGASRGIGATVAKHFSDGGHEVFSVSRSIPIAGMWIKADVSNPNGIAAIKEGIGTKSVDALLFMGGVWEDNAFTDDYDFLKSYVVIAGCCKPVSKVGVNLKVGMAAISNKLRTSKRV
jgi:3-oxoacyl-[acyl-carrier protein] reductase